MTLPLYLHLLMRILIFLVLDSTRDFQLQGLGQNPRKDNEPPDDSNNYHRCSFHNPCYRIFLTTTNNTRPRKAIPLRMRVWSPGVSTTTLFPTIFSCCHSLPPIWPRNCPPPPPPLKQSTPLPAHNIFMSCRYPCSPNPWTCLWVSSRRPWMSRIDN